MIAKLTGVLDSIGEDRIVVDVGGVGYLAYCSGRTLRALPAVGGSVALAIETHVREDHIHLYGFIDAAERDWFKLLTTVQGVGARVALAILTVLEPNVITDAVIAQDKVAFTQAAGVGSKLAARLVAGGNDVLLEELLWYLHVDASAITGLAVGVDSTAMPNTLEGFDAGFNDAATRFAVNGGD